MPGRRVSSETRFCTRAIRPLVAVTVVGVLVGAGLGCTTDKDDGAAAEHGSTTERSSAGDGSATTSSTVPRPSVEVLAAGDDGFYDVPSPLPRGTHGDLVRIQPINGAPEGVTWQRIMYLSQTTAGDPTVETGVVTLPAGRPPAAGWPLFAHAHGSTGTADDCAPSVSLSGSRTYALEIQLLSAWVPTKGIAVVSADYEGLGGPGRHPMLMGTSAGRSVLDSVRAARQVPDTKFTEEVGIVGYSQGGHAAIWANQLAAEWTPELRIVGVMAGAPAADLIDAIRTQGDGAAALLAAAVATVDPNLDLNNVLTDAGLATAAELDRSCDNEVLPEGPLTKVDITTTQPWADALRANDPGGAPGTAPVLIIHSEQDETVAPQVSADLAERLCAAGGVVERRTLDSGSHVAAAIPAYEQGIKWILDLMAGGRPSSMCS